MGDGLAGLFRIEGAVPMKMWIPLSVLIIGCQFVFHVKAVAQDATTLASVDSSGTQGNDASWLSSVSGDGRYVAFESHASNLVANDTNGTDDIFVRDSATGITERVSVDSSGAQAQGISAYTRISTDGRFVLFCSHASNLVSGDTNGTWDVFVHDRATGSTERVSVDSGGIEGNGSSKSNSVSISDDGQVVVFGSVATNLVSNDTNAFADVFVHDRMTGVTERVSVDSMGSQSNADSGYPSLSQDGNLVAFNSNASNLVANDTNGWPDVFVHDRTTGVTERVSVDSSGGEANLDSEQGSISGDGMHVAFESEASNLVGSDTNNAMDVFVHNRATGLTERMSIDSSGTQGNAASFAPFIADNGGRIAFWSAATNLVPNDANKTYDGFVHDDATGITELVSVDSSGNQGNDGSVPQGMSGDGRFVVFASYASNLVPGDTNGVSDDFRHGPYLTLEADPQSAPAGATLTFTTWTGAASGLSLLVVNDVNGAPTFLPAVLGSFDASGLWTLAGIVPSGLSGSVITFETYGFIATGKVDVSNAVAVSFP